MIDFFSSQNSSQNPTLLLVIYTIILAVILSSALAFTYEKTNRDVQNNRRFMQAMILISIVAAMVIQAIGDSVAVGLGMMGALSIIRFRNTVNNPRNIVFIFASLAIGISCGVFGFYIATVGTAGFILTAFVLFYSNLNQKSNMIGAFTIFSQNEEIPDMESILKQYCKRHNNTRLNIIKDEVKGIGYEHHYQFRLKDSVSGLDLNNALEGLSSVKLTRFNIKDTGEAI